MRLPLGENSLAELYFVESESAVAEVPSVIRAVFGASRGLRDWINILPQERTSAAIEASLERLFSLVDQPPAPGPHVRIPCRATLYEPSQAHRAESLTTICGALREVTIFVSKLALKVPLHSDPSKGTEAEYSPAQD